jgi:zinc protease
MIEFKKYTLDNGLRVILHKDESTPIVAINTLYDVGARDEDPNKTGFAHLFEHLMFGGSKNIPIFDQPLQMVGGENNAFTNNNYTNYYITLPKDNIETGFWLESDRMLELAFSEKSLEVQRNVVIEEFNQRYLNQPFGDIWLLLRPLAYQVHPYQWATIGKEISHIENAKMEDVKNFFYKFYAPNNAILVVAGNIDFDRTKQLIEKWYGKIPRRNVPIRNLPKEPIQNAERHFKVKKDVPFDTIYKVYHMANRTAKEYHPTDLLSDVLSNGKSSRFNQNLVQNQKLFSSINAYITGDIDEGLFVVSGKLLPSTTIEKAENAIHEELEQVKRGINAYELEKVKNKIESVQIFSEINVLNKAMNLAFHELIDNLENINKEVDRYREVSVENILEVANKIINPENCSTLHYLANK